MGAQDYEHACAAHLFEFLHGLLLLLEGPIALVALLLCLGLFLRRFLDVRAALRTVFLPQLIALDGDLVVAKAG